MHAELRARRVVGRRVGAFGGMSAAASSIDAPPAIASSAAVARSGVPPMFVSAIAARSIEPFERSTTAATATVAQSCARRVIFTYDQPVEAPSFGTRISTSISPAPTAVWKTPVKNSRRGNHPFAVGSPRSRARRRARESRSAGRRRDRRARASLRSSRDAGPADRRPGPPCDETIGQCSRRSGARRTSLCRVSAPIAICSPASRT